MLLAAVHRRLGIETRERERERERARELSPAALSDPSLSVSTDSYNKAVVKLL